LNRQKDAAVRCSRELSSGTFSRTAADHDGLRLLAARKTHGPDSAALQRYRPGLERVSAESDEFLWVTREFWQRPDEIPVRARTWVALIANAATVSWSTVAARHWAPRVKLTNSVIGA
jgi:hypothetical protein